MACGSLAAAGQDYQIITIIGVQNSGKSTLMNSLFGTNFAVLKEAAGTRTTRGIWVSYEPDQKFIVFDVEGNDSMDRAEDQVTVP
jgi:GTPase Era involved in 16S rRNA processing